VQAFAAVLLTLLRLQDQGLPSLANPLGACASPLPLKVPECTTRTHVTEADAPGY
jgi:hypothetical protein